MQTSKYQHLIETVSESKQNGPFYTTVITRFVLHTILKTFPISIACNTKRELREFTSIISVHLFNFHTFNVHINVQEGSHETSEIMLVNFRSSRNF